MSESYQQIFFGAPGTGKSHKINSLITSNVVRTTFHPDSDYSTFVGAYKPTSREYPLRDSAGHIIRDEAGNEVRDSRIVYEFIPQAFLQAYVEAWKMLASHGEEIQKQYLVIEEINRGNCAQIFGDLFQLLDRNDNGFSNYPINADKDLEKFLAKSFEDLNFDSISEEYGIGNIAGKIKSGKILLLPSNLYIWASMNTSDQSLFPIDSAFKRRWEWTYVPIDTQQNTDWFISANGNGYAWSDFLDKINNKIASITDSEDKKLGFYFCKADGGNEISVKRFVGKVLFYVYNDVFKDYGFDDPMFENEDDGKILFQNFYKSNGDIEERYVEMLLRNLNVRAFDSEDEDTEDDHVEPGDPNEPRGARGRDYSRYSINGMMDLPKSKLKK